MEVVHGGSVGRSVKCSNNSLGRASKMKRREGEGEREREMGREGEREGGGKRERERKGLRRRVGFRRRRDTPDRKQGDTERDYKCRVEKNKRGRFQVEVNMVFQRISRKW